MQNLPIQPQELKVLVNNQYAHTYVHADTKGASSQVKTCKCITHLLANTHTNICIRTHARMHTHAHTCLNKPQACCNIKKGTYTVIEYSLEKPPHTGIAPPASQWMSYSKSGSQLTSGNVFTTTTTTWLLIVPPYHNRQSTDMCIT